MTESIPLKPGQLRRYASLFRNVRNWWHYLGHKFHFTSKDPLVIECSNGIRVEVPLRMLHTFKEVFLDESYLRGFPRLEFQRPVFIDIGANVGYFSLFVASRFPGARVYAYEPMPNNFALLDRNFANNSNAGLTCYRKAVAGQKGRLLLKYDAGDEFTTSASASENAHGRDSIEVVTVGLADILAEHALEQVDFIKLDCEGSEYEILYDCPADVLARIRRLALEIHPGKGVEENADGLRSFLEARHFQVRTAGGQLMWAWQVRD